MKKFLSFMIVSLFLVSGPSWAKHKKSSAEDPGSSGHKKHSKGSKGSRSKSGAEFKVESEINKTDVTFDFKDKEKGKKSGKSRKKKNSPEEESQ